MKRFLFILLLVGTSIACVACLGTAPKQLPSSEVIRRAVIASQSLNSVAISAEIGLKGAGARTLSGTAVVSGTIHQRTATWSGDVGLTLRGEQWNGQPIDADGTFALSSPEPGVLYLWVEKVTKPVLGPAQSLTLLQRWWLLSGTPSSSPVPQSTTPDPGLADQYAMLITVESGSLVRHPDYDYVYHYQVKLGSGALTLLNLPPDEASAPSGELWIDARTFLLKDVTWRMRHVATVLGPLDMEIHAKLTDANTAPAIRAPTGTAALLPLDAISAMILKKDLVSPEASSGDTMSSDRSESSTASAR